ncbi:HupE/UreJ family protein [Histidinibacterium lentulum]|uniref:HupE/UreJ family protein n=1 Tax=Histidinibacterium lentulum TaxID=2480588 RepID=A0A3N2R8Z6_9RHOB|nr:HupE/UreJ family protein [Histidinibacterium lentulum]ROU03950.1 HupE/UreJ family protein [Histidinibacterium lentulum]
MGDASEGLAVDEVAGDVTVRDDPAGEVFDPEVVRRGGDGDRGKPSEKARMHMTIFPWFARKLRSCVPASILAVTVMAVLCAPRAALAHEVSPAIADMERQGGALVFTVAANLEAFVAGIDLEGLTDTSEAERDDAYDALRALPPEELAAAFRAFWPRMAEGIVVRGDGRPLDLRLVSVEPGDVGDPDLARPSIFLVEAALPPGTRAVEVGWAPRFGDLVLRQQGVEAPYTGYLEPGLISEPIPLGGGARAGLERVAVAVVAGIDRILPLGAVHAALVASLALLAPGLAGMLRLGAVWGGAATLGLVAAAGVRVVPGSAFGTGLAGAGLMLVGADALLRGAAAPGRVPLAAGLGLVQGAVLARDPMELRPLDLLADPLTVAGIAAGVLVAALAVGAALYVLTSGLRGRSAGQGGFWIGLVLMPVLALSITAAAGPEAARALLPLAALAAAVLTLPALAGSRDPEGLRRSGGALAALAGAYWLAQGLTGSG